MNPSSAPPPIGDPWHRVDVRVSSVLARTRVSLIGVLDRRAIETIDGAVRSAARRGHTLTLELGQVSSITPDARATLLIRGRITALSERSPADRRASRSTSRSRRP